MSAKEFLDADKRGGLDHAEQKNHARRACYLYAGRDRLRVPGFECGLHSPLHHRHISGIDTVNDLYRVVFRLGFFCSTAHCIPKCPQAADGGG